MSEDEFSALLREIADVKLRYEERESGNARRQGERPKRGP